jgi:exosortase E/protease (VPEID-CTERM system)
MVSVLFDARVLHARGGELAILGYLGDVGAIAVVIVAATLALAGAQIRSALRDAHAHASERPWLAVGVHFASYALFLGLSARVLAPVDEQLGQLEVLAWLAAAAAVAVSWLPVLLPWRALRAAAPQLATALLLGVFVGVVTWVWGQLSMRAWGLVAPTTVSMVVSLLHWMAPEVVSDPSQAIVGTPSFQVIVSPVCSGLEGVGLMTALLGSYVALERRALRVGRALALIPLAVIASFLTNALRIALLVMVGTHVSPEIALGGFHSKAGWLFFCVLSFAFIAVLRSVPFFRREAAADAPQEPILKSVAAPYLVPMLAIMATALLTGLWSDGFDRLYAVRVTVGAAVLWLYRERYSPSAQGALGAVAIGAVVFGVWLVLATGSDGAIVRDGLANLSSLEAGMWIVARAIGSAIIVPIAEELAFRGYVLRRLVSAEIETVDVRKVHPMAWVISSLAFGLLHTDWIAGVIAGLLFAYAQQRRGRLSDAIVAHATANVLLLGDAWIRGQLQWLA